MSTRDKDYEEMPVTLPPPDLCECERLTGHIHEVYPGNGKPPYRPTRAQCEASRSFFGFDTVIAEIE
jgi:hypothetical protein